jgi:hypothetical protein
MKTIHWLGLVALLGSGALACSGSYEVGGEGTEHGGSGSGQAGTASHGSGAGTGSHESDAGAGQGGAGADDELGPSCVPLNQPPPLVGTFAEPEVVWGRLTKLIWGAEVPPPSELPASTTYAWAGDIVTQAFSQARAMGAAPGAATFVQAWLFRATGAGVPELDGDWATALVSNESALEHLLLDPVGEHRQGVFSERAWLAHFPNIPSRGAGISGRLFSKEPPLPPTNQPSTTPSAELTRRQELAAVVDSNATCAGCHALLDPLGYPYGHFDELGEYSEEEDGLPIDTSGTYSAMDPIISYADTQEFGEKVLGTCDASVGLADGFLRAALQIEGIPAADQPALVDVNRERVRQAFVRSELRSYEDLVRAYAQSPLVLRP